MSFDIKIFEPEPVGFQGFICEMSGEQVSPDECLNCALAGAPGCEYGSPAMIAGIAVNMRAPGFSARIAQGNDSTDIQPDFGFSATELLGCPRKYHLGQMYPWWEKPSKLYWAFRGQIMHERAEQYAALDPFAIVERRLFYYAKVRGRTVAVSGAPDLIRYNPQREGWELVDYKTIKKISPFFRHTCPNTDQVISEMPFPVNGRAITCFWCGEKHAKREVRITKVPFQPRGSHTQQMQIYTHLVESVCDRLAAQVNEQLAQAGLDVRVPEDASVVSAELHYMSMEKPKRVPVELWPVEGRKNFITDRLKVMLRDDLPPILNDPLEVWQCNYCPLRDVCEDEHDGVVGKDALLEQMKADKAFDPEESLRELGY
jgi:hypothetical protein